MSRGSRPGTSGSTIERSAETTDILPTLAGMIGLSLAPGSIDGHCLAEVPEKIVFNQTGPGNPSKIIVWKLEPKDSSFDLTVEFQEDFGILVLKNDKSQIAKGGWGNGGGGTQRTEYHMKNEHRKTGTSVYLPIVMQIGALGEEPKMCAAADPKIINE